MECPSCGSANQDSNRFCGNCGAPLPQHVSLAVTTIPIGNSYCGLCGAPLAGTAPLERAVNTPAKPAADGLATTSDYSNVFTRIRDAVAGDRVPPSVSFDHHLGATDHRGRDGDAEGGGCLQVEKQLDFCD
jgi:hypothetical protein